MKLFILNDTTLELDIAHAGKYRAAAMAQAPRNRADCIAWAREYLAHGRGAPVTERAHIAATDAANLAVFGMAPRENQNHVAILCHAMGGA